MSDCLNDVVGENIRERREALGLTKRGLAAKLGSANSSRCVGAWERGIGLPNAYNLCGLADVFGCTVDELLGRSSDG